MELLAVQGVASSVIADQAPKDKPIIVTCDGPRTRIYCLYDDDALDESDANEGSLGFDPLKGEWHVSLPCLKDDLEWVSQALASSKRVSARDLDEKDANSSEQGSGRGKSAALELDPEGFLGR